MPYRNPFSLQKTSSRKVSSRSPLKFPAERMRIEFGPIYESIDAVISDLTVTYDIAHGKWISDGIPATAVDTRELPKLEKTKRELEEDNHSMRCKLDLLIEMLGESTAEHELRRKV